MTRTTQPASATIRQPRRNDPATEPSVRRRLLNSAARLFAENEYSAVRVSDVAAAAGTTTTMITYHFGNRQTLYECAADAALSHLTARFEKARSLRPGARVDGMIKTLIVGLGDERDATRLLQRELLRPPQSRVAATQRCVTRLLELILGTVSAARRAGSPRARSQSGRVRPSAFVDGATNHDPLARGRSGSWYPARRRGFGAACTNRDGAWGPRVRHR